MEGTGCKGEFLGLGDECLDDFGVAVSLVDSGVGG